jgi:serine/threonine-protein kinase HipA
MTINGRRDGFVISDIHAVGRSAGLKEGRAAALLEEVTDAVRRWPEFADRARLPGDIVQKIRTAQRLNLNGR